MARPTTSAHASADPQSAATALMAMGTGAELFLTFSAGLRHTCIQVKTNASKLKQLQLCPLQCLS